MDVTKPFVKKIWEIQRPIVGGMKMNQLTRDFRVLSPFLCVCLLSFFANRNVATNDDVCPSTDSLRVKLKKGKIPLAIYKDGWCIFIPAANVLYAMYTST